MTTGEKLKGKSRNHLTNVQHSEVATRYKAWRDGITPDDTPAKIAEEFGVERDSIAVMAHKMGVEKLGPVRLVISPQDEEVILKRARAGKSASSIARAFNTTHRTIGKYIKKDMEKNSALYNKGNDAS